MLSTGFKGTTTCAQGGGGAVHRAAHTPGCPRVCMRRDKLLETRQLQQLRKRHGGVGTDKLAVGVQESSPGPAGPSEAEGLHGKVMDAYVKAKTLNVVQDEDPHM